jgi:hypothetical protein
LHEIGLHNGRQQSLAHRFAVERRLQMIQTKSAEEIVRPDRLHPKRPIAAQQTEQVGWDLLVPVHLAGLQGGGGGRVWDDMQFHPVEVHDLRAGRQPRYAGGSGHIGRIALLRRCGCRSCTRPF